MRVAVNMLPSLLPRVSFNTSSTYIYITHNIFHTTCTSPNIAASALQLVSISAVKSDSHPLKGATVPTMAPNAHLHRRDSYWPYSCCVRREMAFLKRQTGLLSRAHGARINP